MRDIDKKLIGAAGKGDANAVEALLESGADAKASTTSGGTALMMAATRGKTECVGMLLQVSDINARDSAGRTALIRAAENARVDAAMLLLAWAGADGAVQTTMADEAARAAEAAGHAACAAGIREMFLTGLPG